MLLHFFSCGSNSFACPLEKCIPLSSLCNGVRECPTGDDEESIYCDITNHCKSHPQGLTHRCGFDGKCISPDRLCDGVADCKDASDERIQSQCLREEEFYETGIASRDLIKCPRIPISEVRKNRNTIVA